ncbi:hypothetical protein EXIGLDRAFT_702987 [Exidia glandulosa HHB12029]|uniref:beta-glucosidase n=1 Tax=Exidia glandulosa HHB12029 TaxID=1314781 RepID=A0A165C9P8_EXIGL|nr:hypothetical protein EXIGLDRAFT_702987 [Exidia glandulosa HHB12029]
MEFRTEQGLSYTTFGYSNLRVPTSVGAKSKTFSVTVNVKNTGNKAGKEVVQVYLTDVQSSVVTPNQFLGGFQKVDLAAGQAKDVTIPISVENLAVWTLQNSFVVEAGVFVVKIGNSAQSFASTNVTVS